MAIALQIQGIFRIGDMDVNLNLADAVLPFAGVVLVWPYLKIPSREMCFSFFKIYWWFFGFLLWMMISLFYVAPVVQGWALGKFVGWFVLLAYFAVGELIYRHGLMDVFLKSMFVFMMWVGIFLLVMITVLPFFNITNFWIWDRDQFIRYVGFFGNPNAFGVFYALLFLAYFYYAQVKPVFSKRIHDVFLVVVFLCFILSSSRTAHLTFLTGVIVLSVFRSFSWRDVRVVLVGSVVYFAGVELVEYISGTYYYTTNFALGSFNPMVDRIGFSDRRTISQHALDLWREKPFFGVGLGSFIYAHEETTSLLRIHNTVLWVLTEMGLVGVMFLIAFARLMAQRVAMIGDRSLRVVFYVLFFGAAAASMGMEVSYQRYLWVFLGMAFAAGAQIRQSRQHAHQKKARAK